MIVYLARDIPQFVMYCVNGKPRSSLFIESTNTMIYIFLFYFLFFYFSAKLRKIGCRCVLDDERKALVRCSLPIAFSNRFHSLKDDDVTIKKRDCVGDPQGGLQSRSAYHREYGLRVGSWNFSGLCSQHKQKEVSEALNKLSWIL